MNLYPFITEYELQPEEGCFYDNITGTLTGSQERKAEIFEREKKIVYIGNGSFECKPIKGTKTVQVMRKIEGEWQCSCQFNRKIGKVCSHIMGMYLSFRNKSFVK